MSKNENHVGTMLAMLFAGFCLGAFLANSCNHHIAEASKKVTDTVVVWDTLKWVGPPPVDSVVTGEIRIPIVKPSEPSVPKADAKVFPPSEMDSVLQGQEEGKIGSKDTLWVTVPRTQKRYEDSTYTAWVSGYEPRLDSIEVYRRTVTIVKRETVSKRNRFNVGLAGGIGYGVFSRKPDVWLGIGCTVRLW